MRRLITARSVIVGTGIAGKPGVALLHRPALLLEDEVIASITSLDAAPLPACDEHDDYPDATLCPAFLDIHIHGAMGHDVMEGTPEALLAVGSFLATRGVGAYFPTTVTASIEATLHALAGIANFIAKPANEGAESKGARPLGIHLEGPFISHAKRGVHPPEMIQKPSIELFTRFWEAAEGRISLMTVAPEMDGAPALIEHATRLGVRVSLGHSNADAAETRLGIEAGARSATHTFNAMRALDHRAPGILGTVLDTDDLYAELICDGIHVDPALVRLFWKAKPRNRAILITDGISATGMPEGEYQLGGLTVTVKDGRCLLLGANGDGVLAGSILTLDRAVRNFCSYTAAPLEDTICMVTANPARLMGTSEYGSLRIGGAAHITVLTPSGEIAAVYLRGRKLV
jgi:N-acetylglucosamine-6-phosphate deacetylase